MRIEHDALGPILAQLQAEPDEKALAAELMQAALQATDEAGLAFTPEQLLGIGTHLLAAIRRGESGETLPDVGADTLEQVSGAALELSRRILTPFAATRGYDWNETETLLLAVHFEAAMEP